MKLVEATMLALQGKLEARSHKEDNERVAPRDIDKLDVSLGNVGNFAPKNSMGNKYNGTTEAEYRSKRNRTGRKNDDGVDEYITYNNHYDTAVPTYQDFKWNADEFEKEVNKYRDNTRGQYATKMMISHQKEADKVVDRVREKITNKKTESAEDADAKNIEAIQDIIKKSGITNERTVDLMSKDILKDLKRNYTKGCKDEYGNYYGTVITDAFRKKVQQITGKMPDLKIGESKEIKEEKLGRNRKIRKTENNKLEEKSQLDNQAYWTYVLGYDLLHNKLQKDGPECDVTFDKAWNIAGDFMNSEEYKDTSKSGYDALVDYLKDKKLIENKKQEGRFNPNSENPEIRMKNYKLMLKRALGTDYEVVGKQGYMYYSGFIKNNKTGKCAYYSINQDWNGKDETDNILIRTAKDFKDYTGGTNQYTDIDNFVKDISRLVESRVSSKKEEANNDTKKFTLQVSCGKDDAIITLDINKNASFDDVIKTLKNELYDFPKNFNKK